jgi:hypothetical protein
MKFCDMLREKLAESEFELKATRKMETNRG